MAEFDVSTGHDTYVNELAPTLNFSTLGYPRVRSGNEYRTLLFMPLAPSRIAGRTILSATLTGVAQGSWVSQTLSVKAFAENWNVATVNWNNKPATVGSTVTEATGVLAAGQEFEIDVTALVQAIANGQANYGWQITTSQSTDVSTMRGFKSGHASWVLNIDVSDPPPTPTQLNPTGVIGTGLPVLTVDETDELAQINVQIDPARDGVSPEFDSGWVSTTEPRFETAGTDYDTVAGGLDDGLTTYWRARVKLTSGAVSLWSPWVDMTRANHPALVMDNPPGTDLWDPTPDITAHLSPAGDADTRWQVIIADAATPSNVRYNSGDHITGAALDLAIPVTWNGRKVFPVDGDYRLTVKAWDRSDRVPSEGDPTFVREIVTVTLDVDGTVTAPNSLTATMETSGYPDVVLAWERASDPDKFIIRRDGEVIARVFPDDVRTAPGEFEWIDEGATPNFSQIYAVRAVTNVLGVKKSSASSNTATIFATVNSVWLRSEFGDVELFGTGIEAKQIDKRQTFDMPYRAENVDIITAVGGFEGSFKLAIDNRPGATSVDTVRAILEELRQAPQTEVRMIWGTANILTHIAGLSVTPDGEMVPSRNRLHVVECERFFEIDARDE